MMRFALLAQDSLADAETRPPSWAETVVTEQIQVAGPLGSAAAIVLSAVLILLAVGWLIRQRELLGGPLTTFLAVLRIIVILVAVWMVAQPAWTRIETTSRRAEIVVLADASGSMDTVDPPEIPLIASWRSAIDDPDGPLALVQRAELDLAMAVNDVRMDDSLIRRAIETIEKVADGKLASGDSSGLASCLKSLESAVASSAQWQDIDAPVEKLAHAASRSDHIADAMIDLEVLRLRLQVKNNNLPSQPRQSRKRYVAELLNRFETQVAKATDQSVVVRRATFSDQVVIRDSQSPASWDQWLVDNDRQDPSDQATGRVRGQTIARTSVTDALSYVRAMPAETRVSAVVMLSEGQHNSGSRRSPVDVAAGFVDTPVFTIPIGDRRRRRDIAIHRVKAPAMVFQDDRPTVEAVISSYECEGDEVTVTLSDRQRTIAKQIIRFPSAMSDVAVKFDLPPRPVGQQQYQLDVESVANETSLQNNHAVLTIQTIKSKLFVLVADRGPRWEHRYLEQLFRRDPRVELDKLLLAPKLKTTLPIDRTTGNPLPSTADGWAKFDVVILGDLPTSVMTPEVCAAMSQWIKTGGNAIVIAGQQSMPSAYRSQPWFDLLPVTGEALAVSQDQRPRPTTAGQINPAIRLDDNGEHNEHLWRRGMSGPIPGYVSPFHEAKPTATVLASLTSQSEPHDRTAGGFTSDPSGKSPAWLCVHRVGSGQVAYLSAPISYRLRIRAGDRYHHRFWGQLVRWMTSTDLAAGDGLVKLQTDRSTYDEGQKPGIRVRLSDGRGGAVRGGDVQIELTAQMGDKDHLEPQIIPLAEREQVAGVYQATLDRLPAGVYEVRVIGSTIDALRQTWKTQQADRQKSSDDQNTDAPEFENRILSTTFTVESSADLERLVTEANPVLLKQISEASGGMSIPPAALEEILHVLSLDPDVTENKRVTPLWNRWSHLWLIVGCLTVDWWIRRRRGLV